MRVRLLDQAKEDLVEIKQYYRKIGGALLAKKMVSQIRAPVLALEHNPQVAPPYEISPGIRRLVVADGTFLVFYQLGNIDVEILHIRRAEREPVMTDELEKLT
jgi:plasmid stabilization system protein ParE